MPAVRGRPQRPRVHFDELAFAEDLSHATLAGRRVALDARRPWRMVFEITRDPASGAFVLAYLAYGLGHPGKPWQPSAYQVAHQRLHRSE